MAITAPVAFAALGAAGTVYSAVSQRSASKKALRSQENAQRIQQEAIEEQNRIQERAASRATQKARIKSIREARIKRGAVAAYSGLTGTTGSSGALGATSSITSQLTGDLAYGAAQREDAKELGALNVRTAGALSAENVNIARAQAQGANAAAIGGVASTIFSQAGGFKTIFGAYDKYQQGQRAKQAFT